MIANAGSDLLSLTEVEIIPPLVCRTLRVSFFASSRLDRDEPRPERGRVHSRQDTELPADQPGGAGG